VIGDPEHALYVGPVEVAVDGHADELDGSVVVAVAVAGLADELGEEGGPVDGAGHVEGHVGPAHGRVEEDEVAVAPPPPPDPVQAVPPPAKVQTLVLLRQHQHVPQLWELVEKKYKKIKNTNCKFLYNYQK